MKDVRIKIGVLHNHFQLEEEYRKEEDTKDQFTQEKIHVVKDEKSNKSNDNMTINDEKVHDNNENRQNKRRRGSCFHGGKPEYFKSECRFL